MKTSEAIDKIAEALSLAQKEFKPVLKNKQNPHFKNWYADLSSIFDATREALSKYGLALVQAPLVFEGRVMVTTRIIHKSGQWIESELSLKPSGDTPQAVGSAITYARRYSAQSILGVDAEDDDDGNSSSTPPKPKAEPMPKADIKMFECTNLDHRDWLENFLLERGIPVEKHEAIALGINGYTRKAFDDFLVAKGQKPAVGWVK